MHKARTTSAFLIASLLLLAALAHAQTGAVRTPPPQPSGDVMRIGTFDVPIPWITPTRSFTTVKLGDHTVRVDAPDLLGPETEVVGGWKEIHDRWTALPAPTGPAYKVLVVVHTVSAHLSVLPDRIISIRAAFSGVEKKDILEALALYKVAFEVNCGGARRVEFDLEWDEDTGAFMVGEADTSVFTDFEKFTSVRASNSTMTAGAEKSLAGFEFAFDIYDAQKLAHVANQHNSIPTFSMPFRLFSEDGTPASLATHLFDGWRATLSGEASVMGGPTTPALMPSLWPAFSSNGIGPDPEARLAFDFNHPRAVTSWPGKTAWISNGSISVTDDKWKELLQKAGVATADLMVAHPDQTLAQTLGVTPPQDLTAWGDFTVAPGDPIKVTLNGRWHPRGGAVVHRFDQVPAGATGLDVTVKLEGSESWDLVLRDAGGAVMGRWTVGPKALLSSAVFVAPAGSEQALSLQFPAISTRPGATLEVLESSVTSQFGRQGLDDSAISISKVALGPATGTKSTISPPAEPAQGSLADLASPDLKVQAPSARIFWTTKDPLAEPGLIALTKSGALDVAYTACEALAYQETPSATAALKAVMVLGPFDLNRLVAMRVIKEHNIPVATSDLWRALGSNSWRTRALATELAANSEGKNKEIVLVTMLIDGEAAVRQTAATVANPDDPGSARRLLFFAVNDTSEAVRLTCARQMLKAADAHNRGEALKLVRDDSTYVATSMLKILTETRDPADLDAIRLAIVDRRPLVQACALLAMIARNGDWTADDIRPALKSTDPHVQEALVRLAEAHKELVPREVLERIASGNDAWLAGEAKRIIGSGG